MEIIISVFAVIILFIGYGMYSRKKIYDEVDRLDAWKIEIMNRPVTDELSKLKELKMSGQTEKKFEEWREAWDEIITSRLPDVEEKLYDAEEAADKYRFKKAKQCTMEIRAELDSSDQIIQSILSDLNELVESDQQNKVDIGDLKGIFRENKKTLFAHQRDFGKAVTLFEKELETISRQFTEYEQKSEQGDYIEARETVMTIKDRLLEMESKMKVIPDLLDRCKVKLPQQLTELLNGIREMEGNGFPLADYGYEQELKSLLETCEHYVLQIEQGEPDEAQKGIKEITEKIEAIYDQLEEEVNSKSTVEKELAGVQPILDNINEALVHTKEETLVVQKTYQLNESNIEAQQALEDSLKKLVFDFEAIKEKVDEKKLPFFKAKSDLKKVKTDIEKIQHAHEEFKEMLETLRKDELNAKETIKNLRKLLLESRRLVHRSTLPGLPDHYMKEFEIAEEALVDVSNKLDEKPLDMTAVNRLLVEAEEAVDKVHQHTIDMIDQAELAEKIIQYGNRYRSHHLHIADQLTKAEHLFRSFDYESALEQAATAVEQIEPGALKRMEHLIEVKD